MKKIFLILAFVSLFTFSCKEVKTTEESQTELDSIVEPQSTVVADSTLLIVNDDVLE